MPPNGRDLGQLTVSESPGDSPGRSPGLPTEAPVAGVSLLNFSRGRTIAKGASCRWTARRLTINVSTAPTSHDSNGYFPRPGNDGHFLRSQNNSSGYTIVGPTLQNLRFHVGSREH